MIRLFAAVAIPPEIAQGLVWRQTGLPGARWRTVDQLHITLRFFGDVPPVTAEDLDLELQRIFVKPFDLVLAGAGSFGEGWRIDALWAGVEPSESLERLHARCETAARKVHIKADSRRYTPHVTLAYMGQAPEPKVAAWIAEHNLLKSPPFRVDRFGLYSSVLSPSGSQYHLEREYRLA